MSIRARILILVGCFALMAIGLTGLGLMTIADYNRMIKTYDHAYDAAWRGERFNHLISNVVMETRGLYNAENATQNAGFVASLNHNLDEMQSLITDWQAVATPAEQPRLKALATQTQTFVTLRRRVGQLAAAGDLAEAQKLSTNNRPARIAFQAQVESLVQSTRQELNTVKGTADAYSKRRAGQFLITALFAIAIIMGLSVWVVSHFITTPLRNLASAIIKTSKGEYEHTIVVPDSEDEVASVWRALAVLKERAIEAERLAAAQREAEHREEMKLREILLD
ncbi:MCP four helix bundle domain-containing protein [Asticcacaulis sp. 201]|uniref:MCP four helix bundle domain-containing protein n=1 Tax=Asticcacaulis sp. 201 TaxID=3028787 RepID=UPI0029160D42|nr:MCP four helix bundle domain-containing protein [Asticcacaulis sp. 201]MDV6332547.1 MCP four helix bundle domain-containing protein [Asticcacaulis sp. 201]